MNRVAAYRKLIGLNQIDIANELEINLSTYSQKESGKRDFTESEMIKIVAIFKKYIPDITANDLFFANEVSKLLS